MTARPYVLTTPTGTRLELVPTAPAGAPDRSAVAADLALELADHCRDRVAVRAHIDAVRAQVEPDMLAEVFADALTVLAADMVARYDVVTERYELDVPLDPMFAPAYPELA